MHHFLGFCFDRGIASDVDRFFSLFAERFLGLCLNAISIHLLNFQWHAGEVPRKLHLLRRGKPRVRAQTVDRALAIVADLLVSYQQLCLVSHLCGSLILFVHHLIRCDYVTVFHLFLLKPNLFIPMILLYLQLLSMTWRCWRCVCHFLNRADLPLYSNRFVWWHGILWSGVRILPLLFQSFYEIVLLPFEKGIFTVPVGCVSFLTLVLKELVGGLQRNCFALV